MVVAKIWLFLLLSEAMWWFKYFIDMRTLCLNYFYVSPAYTGDHEKQP